MSDELKRTVQRFYEQAWNRGELAVIDELFSPAYHDHDASAHTGTSGRDSARHFVQTFRAAIGGLNLTIEDQFADGHTIVTRWTCTGTHQGTLMGVAATHRPVEVSGISIDRFDEQGRFLEGWGNWDGVALLRQIGALPAPDPA